MSIPGLIVPLPVNGFSNKLATKVTNKITRNPRFCSFATFVIVLLTPPFSHPKLLMLFSL